MRSILIVLVIAAVGFGSCNNGGTPGAANSDTPAVKAPRPPAQSKLSAEGTQQLMGLVTKYYALKNALVATKPADATAAAATLTTAGESMIAVAQQDSANGSAMKTYLDTVVTQSKVISSITDNSCEQQRVAFGHISNAIYSLLKAVEVKNAGAYKQYCPMAFNDKGAYWLSDEEDIKNPYFGKKMLTCGEVTDSL